MPRRSPDVRPQRPLPAVPLPGPRSARAGVQRAWVPVVLLAGVVVLAASVLLGGPVLAADRAAHALASVPRSPEAEQAALVVDKVGLRGLTAPLLVAAALALRWRTGRWRPLGVVLGALLSLNLVVGTLKLALARGQAVTGDPDLFAGGQAFPSGHSANVACTTSLLLHLAHEWTGRRVRRAAAVLAVAGPSALMCAVSLFLGFHWLSDLVAGVLVGLAVTWGALRADAALRRAPATAPSRLPAPRRTPQHADEQDRRRAAA